MTSREIREKYIKFFVERGHKRIPSAPLVLENDPTTLFTSSGMQPLVPYLKGESHPEGKRLVNSQPSLRLEDLDAVGDNRHTTFFEMLGNWSLGDYFKKEQLTWFWEFLTKELQLDPNKLHVSIFGRNDQVARDEETLEIWRSLGVSDDHIHFYDAKKNWWSRSGTPESMVVGDIGGPDSEVFYEFTQVEHNPKFGDKCHPNCDCGRFLEIGNSVFVQYIKKENGLEELHNRNVDFGGGLERLTAVVNNEPDIFKIDSTWPIVTSIEALSGRNYGDQSEAMRTIADHMKASVFLIVNGVVPSNKLHGYALRRLIRRATVKMQQFSNDLNPYAMSEIAEKVLEVYDGINGISLSKQKELTVGVVKEEIDRFSQTITQGLKIVEKLARVDGKIAFDLYQSYGFPLEITEELFREKGQKIDREQFAQEFEKHKDLSRTASAGQFKGGLAGDTPETRRLHTTAHLLQASLRSVLGEGVGQKGQNITPERLRFDFSYLSSLTQEQLKAVEDMINEKIKEDLPVSFQEMPVDEAIDSGALGFFKERYGEKVKVYSIGPSTNVQDNNPSTTLRTGPSTRDARPGSPFSREICGGPHVERTGEIGHVTITKEESAGAGVRRIYAKIECKSERV